MIPLMLPNGERLDQARNANTLLTTLNHETEVFGFSFDLFFVASSLSLAFSLASYFFPTSASSSSLVPLQPFHAQTNFPSFSAGGRCLFSEVG